MANKYEDPKELRKLLASGAINVSELARRAGLAKTTVHSFIERENSNMRADTMRKVLKALASMGYGETADEQLSNIVRLWDYIPDSQRRLLSQTAESFANKKD